jgi:hypothetical protein
MIGLVNQASNLIQLTPSYSIYEKLKLPIPKSPSLEIYDFAIMIDIIPDVRCLFIKEFRELRQHLPDDLKFFTFSLTPSLDLFT